MERVQNNAQPNNGIGIIHERVEVLGAESVDTLWLVISRGWRVTSDGSSTIHYSQKSDSEQ